MDGTGRGDLAPTGQKTGPLSGVRVVDFSQAIVGPYGTMLLSLMGAEVIKIESMKRVDLARNPAHISKSYKFGERNIETSPIFNNIALNKLSIRLDLTKAKAIDLVKKLVKISNIVVDNFRPGVMSRLGLDYNELKNVKPDIIMISASGVGQTGPESHYAAYAAIFAALGGLSQMTGYPDLAPSEIRTSTDFRGGMWVTFGALVALNYHQRTGRGQFIDLSIQESMATLIGDTIMDYTINNRNQCRQGNKDDVMAPHNCYRCSGEDEWVTIAVATDDEWVRLCHAIGKPDLAGDDRFYDILGRWKNQQELDNIINEWTINHTKHEITSMLQATGVAAFPCMNSKDIYEDTHLKSRGFFSEVEHPVMGKISVLSPPWTLSATPAKIVSAAPLLGQHNEYVFSKLLGLKEKEIAKLQQEEVIF